jgi:hypothetical protein
MATDLLPSSSTSAMGSKGLKCDEDSPLRKHASHWN